MRTIKFRGKRIDTGKFAYGDLIHRNDGDVAIYTNLDTWVENPDDVDAYGDSFRVAKSTVGQFTGLHDKNGKEIYEGDIVEYDWYIIGDKPAYRVKKQVVFDDMGARVGDDRIRNCTNVEVVGNIHDNPELLKQQENK